MKPLLALLVLLLALGSGAAQEGNVSPGAVIAGAEATLTWILEDPDGAQQGNVTPVIEYADGTTMVVLDTVDYHVNDALSGAPQTEQVFQWTANLTLAGNATVTYLVQETKGALTDIEAELAILPGPGEIIDIPDPGDPGGIPDVALVGETFTLLVSILDEYGNPTNYTGNVTLIDNHDLNETLQAVDGLVEIPVVYVAPVVGVELTVILDRSIAHALPLFDVVALPAAPANLTATVNGTTVMLSWEPVDAVWPVTHYTLYRDDQLLANTTEAWFNDTNLASGTYAYTVTASNEWGQGPASEAVEVTIQSPPPSSSGGKIGGERSLGVVGKSVTAGTGVAVAGAGLWLGRKNLILAAVPAVLGGLGTATGVAYLWGVF